MDYKDLNYSFSECKAYHVHIDKWCRRLKYTGLLSLVLLALLAELSIAKYIPPTTQKPAPKNLKSKGGTSRGCDNTADTLLTLLASSRYSTLSASTHPTFAWFVPDKNSQQVEFSIYKVAEGNKFQQTFQAMLSSEKGVMTLRPFSEDEQGLDPNLDYMWQVVILCNPSAPATAQFERSHFRVIPPSVEFSEKIQQASDPAVRATVFAEAGYWYDALSESLQLTPQNQLGTMSRELIQDLIDSELPSPDLSSEQQLEIREKVSKLKEIIQYSEAQHEEKVQLD